MKTAMPNIDSPGKQRVISTAVKPNDTIVDIAKPNDTSVGFVKPNDTMVGIVKSNDTAADIVKPSDTVVDIVKPNDTMVDIAKPHDTMVDVGQFPSLGACPLRQKNNGWPKRATPIPCRRTPPRTHMRLQPCTDHRTDRQFSMMWTSQGR